MFSSKRSTTAARRVRHPLRGGAPRGGAGRLAFLAIRWTAVRALAIRHGRSLQDVSKHGPQRPRRTCERVRSTPVSASFSGSKAQLKPHRPGLSCEGASHAPVNPKSAMGRPGAGSGVEACAPDGEGGGQPPPRIKLCPTKQHMFFWPRSVSLPSTVKEEERRLQQQQRQHRQ